MIKLTCDYCGCTFERKSVHKESKHFYCSKTCEANARRNKPKSNKKLNDIEILENYAIIHIYNNLKGHLKCLIDIEDVEKVKNLFWNIRYDKRHPSCTVYVESRISSNRKSKRVHLHRLITNCPDDMVVDHINGDGLDNRKSNLRICTQKINTINRTNCSRINYVKRDDLYNVSISINNKTKYLCYTRDLNEAKYYADLAKDLIKKGNFNKLSNMSCKKLNLQRNNTTGINGISRLKNGHFQVRYKCKYIGTVKTIEEGIMMLGDYCSQLQNNF